MTQKDICSGDTAVIQRGGGLLFHVYDPGKRCELIAPDAIKHFSYVIHKKMQLKYVMS